VQPLTDMDLSVTHYVVWMHLNYTLDASGYDASICICDNVPFLCVLAVWPCWRQL